MRLRPVVLTAFLAVCCNLALAGSPATNFIRVPEVNLQQNLSGAGGIQQPSTTAMLKQHPTGQMLFIEELN
ncbi:MAG TPA: hypothetical protein VE866_04530 [Candidatus Binatia bacterium]|jgi:hypothetical protein|nr:hypothetical protein [Candidatus Binatia bacterium]